MATNPDVERKGDTMPYTSRNGHMFSLLTKTGALVLRLGEADRAAFMKAHGTGQVVLYGAVMKDYVEIPDALLRKTKSLKKYFDLSYAYVGTLKPKNTKSGAKAKKSR